MLGSHHPHGISRRNFAGFAAAGAGLSLLPLRASAAADPTTLCIMCIDCRFVDAAVGFFDGRVGREKYDIVALAGASLAAKFTTQFPSEYEGLWGQTSLASFVHPTITNVLVLDHRDCGAFNYVYGAQTGDAELLQHRRVMTEVQPWFVARKLPTRFWLMNTDGTVPPDPVTQCTSLPCPA